MYGVVMPRGSPRLRAENGWKNLVGGRVRQLRQQLGLTQSELSGRLAFHTDGEWNPTLQEVLHIENGTRIVTDLEVVVLAKALECSANWLLTGEDDAAKRHHK